MLPNSLAPVTEAAMAAPGLTMALGPMFAPPTVSAFRAAWMLAAVVAVLPAVDAGETNVIAPVVPDAVPLL